MKPLNLSDSTQKIFDHLNIGSQKITAVHEAKFLAPWEIEARLSPDDPIIGLEINGESRAYPIKWLEEADVVEDTIGGQSVLITYCRPCQEASAFMAGLKANNLKVIRKKSGRIIVSQKRGQQAPALPFRIVPWITWQTNHPESKVFYFKGENPAQTRKMSQTATHSTKAFNLALAASGVLG